MPKAPYTNIVAFDAAILQNKELQKKLQWRERFVLARISAIDHQEDAFVVTRRLADELGEPLQNTQRAFKILRRHGLIAKQYRTPREGIVYGVERRSL